MRVRHWSASAFRRHSGEGGQVGPLVLVRLEAGEVGEDAGAAAPSAPLQRGGDQVAQTADVNDVLGRKEPVVAGQVHPPTD